LRVHTYECVGNSEKQFVREKILRALRSIEELYLSRHAQRRKNEMRNGTRNGGEIRGTRNGVKFAARATG
jgi:transcription termination factor Rho